jgi:hypothetical protein
VAKNLYSWNHLVLRVSHIHLRERTYIFRWSLKYNDNFSVSSMYQALLDIDIVPHNSYLRKIKILLKMKVFLWLLYREAILTKDNLVKRNWYENEMCSFCNNHKTIQHLFFDCALAKFIWRVVQLASGLSPPNNIRHMFGAWVHNISSSNRHIFLVGIGAILWVILLSRNDIVFNKTPITCSMQVIFKDTYWTRTWTNFQKESKMKMLQATCPLIETLTMKIFAKHGWWSTNSPLID